MDCEHKGKKLFYDDCSNKTAEPAGVHALVIGVSKYDPPQRKRDRKYKDIVGAASAAAHFARFLTDGFYDPYKIPLRTVRMLLSPVTGQDEYLPNPNDQAWQEASYDNVGDALDDWAHDCNNHHRNVAVLYVAGHGVVTSGGAHWAFLSRAGAVDEPYRYGINLTVIKDRMLFRKARSNIYVFDCCALIGAEVPAWDGNPGLYMSEQKGPMNPGNVSQVIIAPRVGTSTYALKASDGTLLSRALVGRSNTEARERLLYTAGEVIPDGFYAITPRRLGDELLPAMQRIRQVHLVGEEPIILPEKSLVGITRPTPPPEFPVIMIPDSASVGGNITVIVRDGTGAEVEREVVPSAGLPLSLPAGKYRVSAIVQRPDGSVSTDHYDLLVGRAMRVAAIDGNEIL